jgi:predicted 3-demethylubiquinone-9 3-methyltransferase (glyoxalase superfamily)
MSVVTLLPARRVRLPRACLQLLLQDPYKDRAEMDRYWNALLADRDRARAKRVADAMLGMVKLDIAGLEAAYAGKPA